MDISVPKSSLPLEAQICHCGQCRHSSGVLCNSYLILRDHGLSPDPSMLDRLSSYKSSEKITRYFCPTCSCHVLWHGPGQQDWDVPTGCLDRIDDVVKFTKHIFLESTHDGGFSDWLADSSIERTATRTNVLEPGWRSAPRPSPPYPQTRLHAHCECKGVQFYIARPAPPSSSSTHPSTVDVYVPSDSGPADLHENETWWLRADKQKFLGNICACNSCRLMNGFDFTAWAFVPTSDISLDADGTVPFSRGFGTLRAYRSSDKATKRFCSVCGATVFWDGDIRPGLIDVAVGLLDAEEGVRAESWIEWMTEKVSFKEDAETRALKLVEAVEKATAKWGVEVQGRKGPHGGFLEAQKGKAQ